jgi:DNA repair protein RadA/Sms
MRAKTSFSCQACGHQSPRWLGRCPDCSGWNTMKEERQASTGKGRPVAMKTAQAKATPIAEIEVVGEDRRLTQIGEFDRVLGGGVIPGSVILIGGDPGIGKTTLLLQALPRLSSKEEPVLYVSGEESPRQIKMRGQRLGIEHRRKKSSRLRWSSIQFKRSTRTRLPLRPAVSVRCRKWQAS